MDGERALVYPLPVWFEFQSRLAKVPSTSQAKAKLLERVNYFGQVSALDAQGRVLVPQVLRDVAGITDDVVVLGSQDHLIVWNEERIQKRLSEHAADRGGLQGAGAPRRVSCRSSAMKHEPVLLQRGSRVPRARIAPTASSSTRRWGSADMRKRSWSAIRMSG